jgi:hypothetical protein
MRSELCGFYAKLHVQESKGLLCEKILRRGLGPSDACIASWCDDFRSGSRLTAWIFGTRRSSSIPPTYMRLPNASCKSKQPRLEAAEAGSDEYRVSFQDFLTLCLSSNQLNKQLCFRSQSRCSHERGSESTRGLHLAQSHRSSFSASSTSRNFIGARSHRSSEGHCHLTRMPTEVKTGRYFRSCFVLSGSIGSHPQAQFSITLVA